MPPILTDYIGTFADDEHDLQARFCGFGGHPHVDDPQGVRILALCFMAAMVEAGDA